MAEMVTNGDIQGVLKVFQEGFKPKLFHKNIHKLYHPVSISIIIILCVKIYFQFSCWLFWNFQTIEFVIYYFVHGSEMLGCNYRSIDFHLNEREKEESNNQIVSNSENCWNMQIVRNI